MSAPNADMCNHAVTPEHWSFWPIPTPQGGYHSTAPWMARYFQDDMELGKRVAEALDDEWVWGAESMLILSTPLED